ncbi:MAG: sugar ABC transporter ATP-binding protein, partial [Oscillospiraceae bacterium]
ALIGENGAGKSTLMKILVGDYSADRGTIFLSGQEASITSPSKAKSLGIAMIHQELSPVLDMTVAENIFIGREISKLGCIGNKEQERQASEFLNKLGLGVSPRKKMRDLSVSEIQMVEIAKTISSGAQIIIMDEPTSAITNVEAEKLFEAIRTLAKSGIGIIYISHKLEELFEISDRITVLRDGNIIGTKETKELSTQELIKMMVGREINDVYPKCKSTSGDCVLSVRDLSRKNEFSEVSFDLHRGERLGIGGLMGSGRTELVMTIFGERRPDSGQILINGKPVKITSPKAAIKNGMALISEDRKRFGLNLMSTVRDNIVAVVEGKISKLGLFNASRADKISKEMVASFNVKTSSIKQEVSALSGGNQQKVVLAKWLNHDVDIVIFDEPTRGIDVGSKEEIYKIINKLAEKGMGIIIISSEMPELIGLSDRVVVLHEGHLEGELKKDEITQENIMQLASSLQPRS